MNTYSEMRLKQKLTVIIVIYYCSFLVSFTTCFHFILIHHDKSMAIHVPVIWGIFANIIVIIQYSSKTQELIK